jgi:hypothetical protein
MFVSSKLAPSLSEEAKSARERQRRRDGPPALLKCAIHPNTRFPMIELNPIRARIADLTGRLDALRGYL